MAKKAKKKLAKGTSKKLAVFEESAKSRTLSETLAPPTIGSSSDGGKKGRGSQHSNDVGRAYGSAKEPWASY